MKRLDRLHVILAALLGTCAQEALAQNDLAAALKDCARLKDDAPRLACYDILANLRTAGSSVQHAPSATPSPAQEFGLGADRVHQLRRQAGVDDTPPKSLTAHITAIAPLPYGLREFTLDNGQVWQQTESQTALVVKPGDSVRITPGMLGSFWLQTDGRYAIRAKRVR
jgi:hypothetical protein